MSDKDDVTTFDPYALPPEAIEDPPTTIPGQLRRIGPGIILAGMIVGSGELILTTALGARYGFQFLWLIVFSCVIKVFVQVELGRYAISSGRPTLGALDKLGGPRLGNNWLVWWWLIMMLATVFQLGAMTGGTGQSLNLAFPQLAGAVEPLWPSNDKETWRPEFPWALIVCAAAVLLLLSGGYQRIERLTTFLVAMVTFLTILCVVVLPFTDYGLPWREVFAGLWPSLPPGQTGVAEAFAVFGITGVGATELYAYPYWCLEKGYARWTGRCNDSPQWTARARGWIHVMQFDAWASMIVFSLTTIAFYAMGAAVLHPQNLHPEGPDMIKTLSQMYVGPFGDWTQTLFLIGAGFVLFKTLYVASASHSRLSADFLSLGGFAAIRTAASRRNWVRFFCGFYPCLALVLFLFFKQPKAMVVVGGFAQALTLPIISGCALYLRYRGLHQSLRPKWWWDVLLWLAVICITVVALFACYNQVLSLLPKDP